MLQDILRTALHSAVSVGALFVLTRLMGKKQIAQLTLFDYIIGISIGSIAAQKAIDTRISLPAGLTGLIVFALFSIVFSLIGLKSLTGRKILEGTPSVLIENGKIIESNLRKTRININELLEECRQKNAFDIADVEFAVLETSGRLSVLCKAARRPLTPEDMQIKTPYLGLCTGVIMEGKILQKELAFLKMNEAWLNKELERLNIADVSDVLFAYADSAGSLVAHLRHVPSVSPPVT